MRFERKHDVTAATGKEAAARDASKTLARETTCIAFRCTNFSHVSPQWAPISQGFGRRISSRGKERCSGAAVTSRIRSSSVSLLWTNKDDTDNEKPKRQEGVRTWPLVEGGGGIFLDIPEAKPTPNESPKNENKAVPECDREQRLASLHFHQALTHDLSTC